MKKQRVLAATAVLIGAMGLGSCSTAPKSESAVSPVALTHESVMRKVASVYDAGIIGPNGEVIIFYKKGANVVVQQCQDYTVLNRRSDCKTKAGTTVAKVPVQKFKDRLKQALKLPIGDYSPDMSKKLDVYRKGKVGNTGDLVKQQEQLKAAIGVIQTLVTEYGSANADTAKLAQLRQDLAAVNAKLGDNSQLGVIVRELNGLVDRLVDKIIGQPTLRKFVYSKEKQGFEFNILRSYIRTPGLSASFVQVPRGNFLMGSPGSEANRDSDETAHSVTLTRDFEMQSTDVTQLQWFLVMGYNPSSFKSQQYCKDDYLAINGTALCPNNPVEQVSWNDAQAFIQKVNASKDGYTYRLPTEAEFEYAARAGSQAAYSFGNDVSQLGQYAWFSDNSGSQTHAVGTKLPNAYGLYDMHGNVWQWVQDFYGSYPNSSMTDPTGPSSGPVRVFRGGGWDYYARYCRSANRNYGDADDRLYVLGFRLVRTQ